ncbi:VWA domain-containing protein [Paracidobacterium acidisoli]|uniref:VWA domain-containing protein n=1 Tax=Paracidobacterium acidisoli TaxID=2303751 RepID=A0A372INA8_9BACT|nr:VWA domain-containing protein [Paracidobacterium acidisoli]MBT9332042.1 VWA domain-containing protein [Paracidobacterium acidisoli]
MKLPATVLVLAFASVGMAAQNQIAPVTTEPTITLKSEANLVLVPTWVTTQTGETVFSLTSQNFSLLDNGVPQKVTIDDDINPSPLSIVVAIETGGYGRQEIASLGGVETMVEAIVGERPHEIALVTFDSQPHLIQDFTPVTEDIGAAIQGIQPGDHDAAILDGLQYAVKMLQSRSASNRRIVLLISETFDHGSQAKADEVFQTLRSSNTPIYSVAFSTTQAEVHETLTTPSPGRAKKMRCLQENPGAPPGTCRGYGALGRLLVLASRAGQDDDGSESNVAQTAAAATGGKYLPFDARGGRKDLEKKLYSIANDLPNRYILSFRPMSPTPGLHNLQVSVQGHPELQVSSRSTYWVRDTSTTQPNP